MLRRHFFLAGALLVLVLMIVAGGLKLMLPKAGGEPGQAHAGQQAGGRGGPGGGRGGPTPVSVVQVAQRTFTDTIDVLGVAKGRQSVTLSAATTQLVDQVRFTAGQQVAKGQVLVVLKASEQDAGVVQSRARLVQAQREYDRWKTLNEKGFASKSALDQYEASYESAKADLAAAQARQADRVIRAPFAGVVGLTDIAPGAVINPGAAIVTLDDLSAVRVDFQVPDRFLTGVREGQPIVATADAYPGATFQGRVAKLDTRIDERTRALTARAEFPNGDHRLKPGMMLRVAIAQGARQALAAPETAVQVQGDSAFVFVLGQQGQKTAAQQRPVVTGARQGGFVELKDGVRAGDRIVGDGLNKIQDGQPVRIAGPGGGHPGLAGARRAGEARPRA